MSSSVLDGRLPANGVENQDKKLRSKVPRTKIAHIGVSSDKRPAAEAERDNGPLKLRCPFRAHDPDRYKKVHSHCRAEQSFPNIGKLNEHIGRYHSLRYWCIVCKRNFPTVSKKDIDHHKRSHICHPRIWSGKEEIASHTYMTEEQQESWAHWKDVPIQAIAGERTVIKSWRKIYKSLFPADTKSPSPHYDSGSSPQIEASRTASSISTTVQDGTATGQDEITLSGDEIDPVNGGGPPNRVEDDPHIISGKRKATSEPDADQLFITSSKYASLFTATEETASEVTATNAHELDRGEHSPGTVDNFNPIFGDPFSADLKLDQIKQREAGLNQADWDDGPGSMVNSLTSETTLPQPPSLPAAQDILGQYPSEIYDLDLEGIFDDGIIPDQEEY